MNQYIINVKTGEKYCRYCKSYDCVCLDEGRTPLLYKQEKYNTGKATLFALKKQKLPNGRGVPTGTDLWIPNKHIADIDDLFKRVVVENEFLNQCIFSE